MPPTRELLDVLQVFTSSVLVEVLVSSASYAVPVTCTVIVMMHLLYLLDVLIGATTSTAAVGVEVQTKDTLQVGRSSGVCTDSW